jgi:hypothetical protein
MKDKPTTDWTVVLRTSVITQIITAICTFAVTLSGTYCAQQWQDDRHLQERRRQTFGELMGVRATLTQVVRDFQDSKIHGAYNLQVYALTNDKIGFDEGRRYQVGVVPPIPSPGNIKTVEDLNEWHNKQLVANSETSRKKLMRVLGKFSIKSRKNW